MASTAAFNNKNAQVYSPASAHRGEASAPAYNYGSDNNMAAAGAANIPYAVQVDAVPQPPAGYLPPMHVAGIPMQPLHAPTTNEWKIDFCGCCATPVHCCMAFFFPCVNAAYAAHGIHRPAVLVGIVFFVLYTGCVVFANGPRHEYDAWFTYDGSYGEGESTYSTWGLVSAICAVGFVVATAMLRRAVRRFDGIPGSAMTDVCASFWCSCCVLSQLSAHTERVKPLRNAAVSTLPAYHAAS